jgi:hypothetical protein
MFIGLQIKERERKSKQKWKEQQGNKRVSPGCVRTHEKKMKTYIRVNGK